MKMCCSNALGTINPVAEEGRLAHRVGALLLVDGSQSVPHMPVDVKGLNCDVLASSSHKMVGPTGVGVLYGREALLDAMSPFLAVGDMIDEVGIEQST
jgi:cysteine desulfurase/selenocysteine lyase